MVAARTDVPDVLEGLQNRSDLRRQMKIYNRTAAATEGKNGTAVGHSSGEQVGARLSWTCALDFIIFKAY